MIIGFIGFGKVAQTLLNLINSDEINFITSFENQSVDTVDNIKKANISVLDNFEEVASKSDILISANSPKSAFDVAKRYGKYAKGIYLDLNNISPKTTYKINEYVDNLVDGAIIGKIDSDNPTIYISGSKSDELLFLNDFIDVYKLSEKIGDVAILKILRSIYTKVLSAILIESSQIARNYNLENEFFDILTLTEGKKFKEKSQSRIINTLNNSKRKIEELEEIINYFDNENLIMTKSAIEKFKQLLS